MRLNLGCCDRHMRGFIGVDIFQREDLPEGMEFQKVDLAAPWPWETSSVDEILALDVVEHIGDCNQTRTYCQSCELRMGGSILSGFQAYYAGLRHPLGRIHFMNELHRVMKPGARATIETPNAAHGVGFFQDPTHVAPWCFSTFKYFEAGKFAHDRLAKAYGITAAFRIWQLDEQLSNGEDGREKVWKIHAELEAVK